MSIVALKNISKEYAGRHILDNVSLEINAGQKLGLIGPNGSGKTTILKIICGDEKANAGKIELAADVRIGYVPQHITFTANQSVHDYIMQDYLEMRSRLTRLEAEIEKADETSMDILFRHYQKIRDEYDHMGGDHFEQRAHVMLDALGLAGKSGQNIHLLSGGEQNVLGMAHALLADPNLLILDEPGNHLDYLGLAWLEDFLKRFRGAVLVVSHNRYLLDKVVGFVLELEDGKLERYNGNYTAYRHQKEERHRARQNQYEAQQKRIAQLEALVQKFADIAQGHASDNTWGKRLRARRSQLEHEKSLAIDKPRKQAKTVSMKFQTEATRADIAMQLRNYAKAYGERRLFENVSWDIHGGQRWALVGANGTGKTSLFRDIVELGKWEHPVIRIGPSLSVGYAAQQQEVLHPENTVYEELFTIPDMTHEKVLKILARFLFTDEEVYKKIKHLSGGERNRLQLARLMLLQPNFLILDEPTNHLDIPTREAVEQALSEFEGTLLVISHDRYFLDKVVDHVAEVRDLSLVLYDGNFSRFWETRQHDAMTQTVTGHIATRGKGRRGSNESRAKVGGEAWKQRKAQQAAERKKQKEVESLEEQIAHLEQNQESLEAQIADAFSAGDMDLGHELSNQLQGIQQELDTLFEQWMSHAE